MAIVTKKFRSLNRSLKAIFLVVSLRRKCFPLRNETPPKKIIEATRGTSKGEYRSEEEEEEI